MRLLICTQSMDRTDPVLGFFHAWVVALANKFDHITVIALSVGDIALPENVTVHSLGKEKGKRSRIVYATRFLQIASRCRDSYDAVFVHMNTEYVFLGAPLWRDKKVALWYNHEYGGLKLRLATALVDMLFHTSPYAASAGHAKSRLMPAGIDTDVFKPQTVTPQKRSIYFQGRISRSKRVATLLEALRALPEARLTLVGPSDPSYESELRIDYHDLIELGRVVFRGAVPNIETPALYASHMVSVNLTARGNYDKSVLESITCGTPAVVSSPAFKDLVPQSCYFVEDDSAALADTLRRVLSLSEEERSMITDHARQRIEQMHSLKALTHALADAYRIP